ncbi:unnamed protein product [Closterium sp. Yama58-4]|nr:unnamed protein product [Closterium sp. Yama58-4]
MRMAVDLNCEASAGSPRFALHEHVPDAIPSDCPDESIKNDELLSPRARADATSGNAAIVAAHVELSDHDNQAEHPVNDDYACPKKRARASRKDPAVRVPVGTRVRVLWPRDGQWHAGRVTKFDAKKALHTVTIDRGESKRIDLRVVPWSILVEGALHPGSGNMHIGLAGSVHLGGGSVRQSEGAYIADGVSYSSSQLHSRASSWQGHHPPAYGGSMPVAPPQLLPPPPPPLRLELPWQAQAQPAPYSAQQTQGQPAGSHGQYNTVQHMQVTQPLEYQQPSYQQPDYQQPQMQQPQQRQPVQEPSPAPAQHYYPQEYAQQQSYQYAEHQQQILYPQQLRGVAAHAEYTSAQPVIPADPTSRSPPALLHIPAFAPAPPSARPADAPCPCCHRRNPPAPVSTAPLVYKSLPHAPPPEVPPRISAPMPWRGNGAPPASPVISAAPTGGTAESAYAGESRAGTGAGSCAHLPYPCGSSGSRWTGGPAGGPQAGCTGGGNACGHGCTQGYSGATYEMQQQPMYEEGARGRVFDQRVSGQAHPQSYAESSPLPRGAQTAAWLPSPAVTQSHRHRDVPCAPLSPSCWTYGDQRTGPAAVEHPAEAAVQQPRLGQDRRANNQRLVVVVASSSGSGVDSDSCSGDGDGDGDGSGRRAGVVWPVTSDEMNTTVAEMPVAVLGGQMNGQQDGQMAESEDTRRPSKKIEEVKFGECLKKRKREEVCGEAGAASEKDYQRAAAVAAPSPVKPEMADCDMEAVELILAVAHQLRDGKEPQATPHATDHAIEGGREEEGVRKLHEDRGAEDDWVEGKGEVGSGGGAAGATAEASGVPEEVPAAAAPAAGDDKQRFPACSSGPFPPLHPVAATVHMASAGLHGSHPHTLTPVSLSASSDSDCTGSDHSKPGAWGFAMRPCGGCGVGGHRVLLARASYGSDCIFDCTQVSKLDVLMRPALRVERFRLMEAFPSLGHSCVERAFLDAKYDVNLAAAVLASSQEQPATDLAAAGGPSGDSGGAAGGKGGATQGGAAVKDGAAARQALEQEHRWWEEAPFAAAGRAAGEVKAERGLERKTDIQGSGAGGEDEDVFVWGDGGWEAVDECTNETRGGGHLNRQGNAQGQEKGRGDERRSRKSKGKKKVEDKVDVIPEVEGKAFRGGGGTSEGGKETTQHDSKRRLVGGQADQGGGEGAQGGGGARGEKGEGGWGSAYGDVEMEDAEGWYPGGEDAAAAAAAAGDDAAVGVGSALAGAGGAASADGQLRRGGVGGEQQQQQQQQQQKRLGVVQMDENMEDAFQASAAAAAAAAAAGDAAGDTAAGSARGDEQKLATLCDAFPSFDRAVVAAFLESLEGDMDGAAHALLAQETAAKAAAPSAPAPSAGAASGAAAAEVTAGRSVRHQLGAKKEQGGGVEERAVMEQLLLLYPRVDRDSLLQVLRACAGSLSDTCAFLDSSEVAAEAEAAARGSSTQRSRAHAAQRAGQRRREEVPLWKWRAQHRAAERAAAAAAADAGARAGGYGAADGGVGGDGYAGSDGYGAADNHGYWGEGVASAVQADAGAGTQLRVNEGGAAAAAAAAAPPAAVAAPAAAAPIGRPASPPKSSDCYKRHREAAFERKRMMQYYFREASEAWRRGERQRAAALADKGHEYREEYQELMQEAGQRIFRENNERLGNNMDVDLHHLHVDEALQHLQLHLTLLQTLPTLSSITVITGRGKHSASGQAKIKPAVHRYLQERGVGWQEQNAGSIRITRYNLPPDPIRR